VSGLMELGEVVQQDEYQNIRPYKSNQQRHYDFDVLHPIVFIDFNDCKNLKVPSTQL
jgi:hypothetical protein